VLEFRNDHLAYALTWFALAAMATAAAVVVLVSHRRQRREFAPGADR
jgi:surfeit locus 1 family protein